jgi:hypothetical protein
MRVFVRVSLVVCLAALAAGPAAATHGGIHPTLRTERTYFTCVGATKVQNVSMLQGQVPGWDTSAPTQSVQQGAGCGTADTALTNTSTVENGQDGAWKGTFTGNLKDLTIEAHMIDVGASRTDDVFPVLIWLIIDGNTWIERTTQLDVPLVRSSTGASGMLKFSITGLGKITNVLDSNGNVIDVKTQGLVTEDGDGTAVHEITLGLRAFADYPTAWVWDTTEVPSGITFNPATLEAARVAATPPV